METVLFIFAAAVAVVAALMVITRSSAVHALLYFVVLLLALTLLFVLIGAPFAAALQVIVYAGAIMVLFIFVIMMLNLSAAVEAQEKQWLVGRLWRGPATLAALLLIEFAMLLPGLSAKGGSTGARAVGMALFGPYLIAVEAASLLLLAGVVAAWHLGRPDKKETG
jgi:NADH-quinone oxidoreductase subunit J